MRKSATAILLASVALAFTPAVVDAHGDHAAHEAQAAGKKPGAARVSVADTALLDQDGAPRNVKSDVVGDRIVVMDFVYTTCTTVCPVVSATFSDLQRRLGERLGKEVALVSITLDPVRDTPGVLKAYGAKHGARDGWVWLTGSPPTVNSVLKGFGAYVEDPAQHPAMVLVGDGRTGNWTRFFGFPTAAQLLAKVDELRLARASAETNRKEKG